MVALLKEDQRQGLTMASGPLRNTNRTDSSVASVVSTVGV